MKNLLLILLGCSLMLMSCDEITPKEADMKQNNQALAQTLSDYHTERLALFPMEATYAGVDGYNHLLPNNISQAGKQKEVSFYKKYQDAINMLDYNVLNDQDQMSVDILKWECEINLEARTFEQELTPIDQFWTQQLTIGQMASGASAQPFETVQDYDNWLQRLDAYVVWCDTAIMNMKRGMAQDYVLPQSLSAKVIPQFATLKTGPVVDHLFYSPIKNMPESITGEDKDRLTESYTDMIEQKIIPTYQKLSDFFEREYLPKGRKSTGISAVPNGKAFYDHKIKKYTTTDMTADEIYNLGKQEVARLLSEMESVKKEVGFEGDMKAFFEHVRTKKELMPFTDPQQVIDNFNAIHDKMKPNLAKLFDLTPKAAFEVRRTEAFREASGSAEYNPGSLDGTRPGVFYVPIPDVTKYNIVSDEDLFLHEAIPGHHYQISLQQEDEDLPEFRKTLWYSAYGEGWALYCESLGKELGLYDDPYQYFGMLSAEMHRAIRLVVDAGMHAKGMTREEAIQYSLDNEAEPESSIISEIERYMAEPGQALSYKIGQLKIRELRSRSEKALGDQFDIKQFHNIMLESGCVPLRVLEAKVDRWIASF